MTQAHELLHTCYFMINLFCEVAELLYRLLGGYALQAQRTEATRGYSMRASSCKSRFKFVAVEMHLFADLQRHSGLGCFLELITVVILRVGFASNHLLIPEH